MNLLDGHTPPALRQWWMRWTEPSPRVIEVGDRHSVRLLATLLLAMIPLGLLSATVQLLVTPDFGSQFGIIMGALVVLGLGYAVSRTRYYRLAMAGVSLVPLFAGAAIGLAAPGDPVWFGFTALGTVLASAFLPRRYVGAIGLLAIGVTVSVVGIQRQRQLPGAAGGEAVVSFAIIISALLVLVAWHRERLERVREDQIREGEARYRTLFENAPLGIAVATLDGELLEYNDALLAPGGYTRADAPRLSNLAALYGAPETRSGLLDRLREQGRVAGEEARLQAKDGSFYPAALHLVPVSYGGRSCALAIVEDLRPRQVTDAERSRISEERDNLAAIIQLSLNEIYVFDPDTLRFVYANEAARRNLGYSLEQLRSLTPVDLKPEFDRASFRTRIAPLLRDETRLLVFETIHRRADGSSYPVEVRLQLATWQGRRVFLAVILDVTTRKQAEESVRRNERRLEEAEERFRTLVANIPGTVYRSESRFPYRDLFISEGILGVTGYPVEAFMRDDGPRFGTMTLEADRARVDEAVQAAVASLGTFSLRYRVRHADGGIRWVMEQGRATRDLDSGGVFLDGVLLDVTLQAEAEAKLREREERLRAIVESGPECVMLLDRDGNLLDMNPAGLRLIEAESLDQVRGRCVCPLVVPEDEPAFRAMIAAAFRGESRTLVFDVVGLKGTRRTLESSGGPLWDGPEHHEVRALLGVTRDITERRRAELAHQESEERYRSLVASVPGAVYICEVTPPWKDTFMSEGIEAITGRKPEEFVRPGGLTFADITLAEDIDRVAEEIAAGARSHGVFETRYRIRRPDGTTRWVHDQGRAVLDQSGQPRFLTGVILDITDRMAADEAVRASQARLVEAQRIAGIGSWELNLVTGQGTWSAEVQRILERDPREFTASYQAILECAHPEDRPLLDRAYTQALDERKPFDLVHRLLLRDGRVKYVHARAETQYDAAGRPIRSMGTIQDITERREAEQARQALETQLRQAQKLEAIGTLAGGIAHDFNNILTAIIGHAELLALELPSAPVLRDELDGIVRASLRARDLVAQILTFSRQREQERKLMALQPVVLEALRLLRATLPATIEIRTEVASDETLVLADATQVHGMILNLCTNAAHAMRERGGVLSVRYGSVQVDEAFALTHRGLRPGPYVRLTVSDTGHGMDSETLERIFDPFFTTKPPGEGTGLGLAVLHGIMQAHDGVVTVYSQPGKGASFNLYFPVAAGTTQEQAREEPSLPQGGGRQILVVDDEPALVSIARRALTQLGYEVVAHTRPAEALEEFRKDPQRFDLVLCDLTMPRMSGLDFAAQLFRIRPEMPVVLASGHGGPLGPEDLHRLGIRELLGKPFTIAALAEAVHRNLPPRG